ncbi:glycosyl transferase [Arthrobacter sp. HMWF013]|nr:glycosyl transferase [Arthrobacter sp. HMWF013]
MSGAQDWTAFLFGSSDSGNAISVDKPPLSLWIMSLSVRLFGLSSWSILLPQAAMGVASVYLLFRLVRTQTDTITGLAAGTFLAVTPVATVIFRYNNPDALLTLLMIGIAYCTLESIQRGKVQLLIMAGVLSGAAFLTKQLQVGLIIPAIGAAYFAFAPFGVFRRAGHLLLAATVAVVSGGWWFLLVQLTDPGRRPYVGGSRLNSIIELTMGYNGLDRLTGADAGRTMAPETQALAQDLDEGFQRFLQPQFSGQFGWFLPLAVAGLCMAVFLLWKRRGSKSYRAFLLLCVAWFICSASVLAFMSGIYHPYYALSVVPSLCALAAVGLMSFLRTQHRWQSRSLLAITLALTMTLAFVSAARSTNDFPGLPLVFLALWGLTIAVQLVPTKFPRVQWATTLLLLLALTIGPILWSINTVMSPHAGAGVVAGPSLRGVRTDHPDRQQLGPNVPLSFIAVMFGDVPNDGILRKIEAVPDEVTWATAVVGSESAANYQLELGRAVMPIGGFDGTDPYPTLEQFKTLVDQKRVGSLTVQNLPPLTSEGRGESARIVEWVRSNFAPDKFDGSEFYDLAQ